VTQVEWVIGAGVDLVLMLDHVWEVGLKVSWLFLWRIGPIKVRKKRCKGIRPIS